MLIMLMVVGITAINAQDVKLTNGSRGFVAKTNYNVDIDSAETHVVQVLLNTSEQPKIEVKVNIDSASGTGSVNIYQWFKLFADNDKTYVDTISYSGVGTDTTFTYSHTSVQNYRYWGMDLLGTGGAVNLDSLQLKAWD